MSLQNLIHSPRLQNQSLLPLDLSYLMSSNVPYPMPEPQSAVLTTISPLSDGSILVNTMYNAIGYILKWWIMDATTNPLRVEINNLKRRVDTLNMALTRAENQIVDLVDENNTRTLAAMESAKVHVLKMGLLKEFFGKPNNNVEEFLIGCNMYIAAGKVEFTDNWRQH